MKTSKFNQLNSTESYDIERVLSYILDTYNKHSRPSSYSDYRLLEFIALSPAEVTALAKLHDIFYSKLYE